MDDRTLVKLGTHHAVINNEVVRNIPSGFAYVTSQSELSLYADEYPGFIVAQYGFGKMWQKKPDGTWATIV